MPDKFEWRITTCSCGWEQGASSAWAAARVKVIVVVRYGW